MIDWNRRYLAYCRATGGLSPDATWQRDGTGHRYMIWIQARWREWYGVIGHEPLAKGAVEHAAFDAWLQAATVPTDAQGQTELALETA